LSMPPPGPPGPHPGYPAPAYPGYPAPAYPGYPAPAYPGYSPYPPPHPGYPPPHPGYPPPGGLAPAWKPGVIPLRPLSLSDIFNAAVTYIRANPTATLGLTTVIVLITSLLGLIFEVRLPAAAGDAGMVIAAGTAVLAAALGSIVLSGMLTVVVARAVLGVPIGIAEAWRKVRGRLPALIGLALLEILAVLAVIAATAGVIAGIARAANPTAAVLIGMFLVFGALVAIAYLFTVLAFAPVAIVLERATVPDAIRRSFGLARRHFWRILGIRLLAFLVAAVVSGAVTIPFAIASGIADAGPGSTLLGAVIAAIGSAIGQIITAPFTAGVTVLLYVDSRIRSEAFDLLLQSRAAPAPAAASDDLWLTAPR
jgi:hypothetical protein